MGWLPFTAQQLWPLCTNYLPLPNWIMLVVAPRSPITKRMNIVTSLLLAGVYASIVIPSFVLRKPDAPEVDFLTLQGVSNLFKQSDDEGVMAAWIHYIVFDLWTGRWIANDYETNVQHSIGTKAFEIVSLALTLMFGPIGLALWLVGKYTFLPTATADKIKAV